jgi:hypothetical protein
MTDPKPNKLEPIGCTLGDLMVLTLGVAIAACLDWYSSRIDSNLIGIKLAPGWYSLSNQGIEFMQKACVALVPVILARRMRFGGPLRPVECFPLMTGAFLVSFSMSRWPVFALYYSSPNPPHHTLLNMEAYYVWELSEFAFGVFAGLVVLARWRCQPGWLRGLAFAISWYFLTTWIGYFYQQWANDQLMTLQTPRLVGVISTFLVSWPQQVVNYLPAMIAILDLARPTRLRWTWVVWAAALVAMPMPVLYEARYLARWVLDLGDPFFMVIGYVGKVLALATSFVVARWTEPAWRWFLMGAPDDPNSVTRSEGSAVTGPVD